MKPPPLTQPPHPLPIYSCHLPSFLSPSLVLLTSPIGQCPNPRLPFPIAFAPANTPHIQRPPPATECGSSRCATNGPPRLHRDSYQIFVGSTCLSLFIYSYPLICARLVETLFSPGFLFLPRQLFRPLFNGDTLSICKQCWLQERNVAINLGMKFKNWKTYLKVGFFTIFRPPEALSFHKTFTNNLRMSLLVNPFVDKLD